MGKQISGMKLTQGSSFNGSDITVTQPGIGTSAEMYKHHAAFPVIERRKGQPDELSGTLHGFSKFISDSVLQRRQIIRIDYGSGVFERYRIESYSFDTSQGAADYRALRVWADLARTKFRWRTEEGPMWSSLPYRGRSVADALAVIVDPDNGCDPFFQVGNIDASFSSSLVALEANDSTHLDLIRNLIEQLKTARPVFREDATNCYIDIVPVSTVAVNAKILGPQGDDTDSLNRRTLRIDAEPSEYLSRVLPLGNDPAMRLSRLRWQLASVPTDIGGGNWRYTLSDKRLIWRNDCWNGYKLETWVVRDMAPSTPMGTIIDCDAAAGTIDFTPSGSAPTTFDQEIRILDASGNQVDFIVDEIREAADGRSEESVDLPSANPHREFFSGAGGSADMSSGSVDGSGNFIPDLLELIAVDVRLYLKELDGGGGSGFGAMTVYGDATWLENGVSQIVLPVNGTVFSGLTVTVDSTPVYDSGTDTTTFDVLSLIELETYTWDDGQTYGVVEDVTATSAAMTSPADVRYGDTSVELTCPVAGTGFRTTTFIGKNASFADLPFWSVWMAGRVKSGRVRLSVIDGGGSGKRLPYDLNGATMVADDVRAVAASFEKPNGYVKIYIEAMEPNTVFLLDALTYTNSERGVEWSEGMGPGDLVEKAAAFLLDEGSLAAPSLSGEFFDLAKLEGGSWVTPVVGDIVVAKDLWGGASYALDSELEVVAKRDKLISPSFVGTLDDVVEGVELQNKTAAPTIIDNLAGLRTAFVETERSPQNRQSQYAPQFDVIDDTTPVVDAANRKALFPGTDGWYYTDMSGIRRPIAGDDRPIYPEDFRAAGDEVTDDTKAVELAWVAHRLSGKELVIANQYLVTESLSPTTTSDNETVNVRFSHTGRIRFKPSGTSDPLFELAGANEWRILHPRILGDDSLKGDQHLVASPMKGIGIKVGVGGSVDSDAGRRGFIYNPVCNFLDEGIRIERSWIVDIYTPTLTYNNIGLYFSWQETNGGQHNAINVFGGKMEANRVHGVKMECRASSNINFWGTCIEGNGRSNGWYIPGAWSASTDYGTTNPNGGNVWVYVAGTGINYKSLQTPNLNKDPATNPTYWEVGDPFVDDPTPTGCELKADGYIGSLVLDNVYFEKGNLYCPWVMVGQDNSVVGAPLTGNDVQGGNHIKVLDMRACSFSGNTIWKENRIANVDRLRISLPQKAFFGHQWIIEESVRWYVLDEPDVDDSFQDRPSMWLPIEASDNHSNALAFWTDFSELDAADFPITSSTPIVELDGGGMMRMLLSYSVAGATLSLDTTNNRTGQQCLKFGGGGTSPSIRFQIFDPRDPLWLERMMRDRAESIMGASVRMKCSNEDCVVYPYVIFNWTKDVAGTPTTQVTSQSTRSIGGEFWNIGGNVTRWGWNHFRFNRTNIDTILDDPDFISLDSFEFRIYVKGGSALSASDFVYVDEVKVFTSKHGFNNFGEDPRDQMSPIRTTPQQVDAGMVVSDEYRVRSVAPKATILNTARELIEPGERVWTVGTLPPLTTAGSFPRAKYGYFEEDSGTSAIVLEAGPRNREIPVWECTSDGSSAYIGLRTPAKEVDHLRGYYVSIMCKAADLPSTGNTYFALADPDSSLLDAQDGSADTLMWSGQLADPDEWYLFRGYVHASNESNIALADVPNVGIYRVSDGTKVASLTRTLRMTSATQGFTLRVYNYDAGMTSGIRRLLVYPSIREDSGQLEYDQFFAYANAGSDSLPISDFIGVRNGDAGYADTTNWEVVSGAGHVDFDPRFFNPNAAGRGSFYSDKYLGSNIGVWTTDFIPVDVNRTMRFGAWIRCKGTSATSAYFAMACFDSDGNHIDAHNVIEQQSGFCTPSVDAASGDLYVDVEEPSLFTDSPYSDYLIAYPYKDHPVGYSHRAFRIDWANSKGAGSSSGHPERITFFGSFPMDDDGVSAGTAVTLSADITSAGQTSITLGSSGIPDGTILHLQNGSTWERIRIISSSGTTYTVERGVDASTATTWTAGDDCKRDADLIAYSAAGATYQYIFSNFALDPSDTGSYNGTTGSYGGWHYKSTDVTGIGANTIITKFRRGTAFVKPLFLPNYTGSPSGEGEVVTAWADVDVRDITDDVYGADNVGGGAVEVFKQNNAGSLELRTLDEDQFQESSDLIQLKAMAALTETVSDVSGSAGASYTATEQGLINDLIAAAAEQKAAFDELVARLQTRGDLP